MDFWEKIKSDIQKGIREGIGIVKEGAIVVRAKAEELTEEGKKRLKVFEQNRISRLDPRSYYTVGQQVMFVMLPENVLILKKD